MPRSAAQTSTRKLASVPRDLRLSDKVTEQLTEAITSGQFPVGSRLPSERELGDQLKVSRTVIREAVRSVAAIGLVTVTAGRGVEVVSNRKSGGVSTMRLVVKGFGEIDYAKVHDVRVPLEGQAAALAARHAKPDDVQRLRAICDRHAAHIAKGNLAGSGKEDLAFHDEVARLAGNPLLLAMYRSMAEVLSQVRSPARHNAEVAEAGLRAHRWLLECIANGDPDAARSAMERHLIEANRVWGGA